jgi:tetratricopeptide (TPR) repeat protein
MGRRLPHGYAAAIDGYDRVSREPESPFAAFRLDAVGSVAELALLLRELRRRHARLNSAAELTYRELASRTGWSHGIIGEYLAGRVLPPTDRFDVLIRLLGASPAEQGALATVRDRVEETRRGTAGSPANAVSIPRHLPAEAFGFTGRGRQLAELDAILERGTHDSGVVICALSGMAGVGKTSLALHWAHRLTSRFPDGQLYLDLRGYDREQPVSPADALARFIRSLGVAPGEVPADLDERAAFYRSLLAGRRMLVLLDNASGVEQVRPLLPGTASCLVLITSRNNLAGLVAREGARRVDLDVLDRSEAIALLRAVIGKRVDAEPEAALGLVQLCAGLPLALRIAAETAVARPAMSLSRLVGDLWDEKGRLDLLSAAGDTRTAVRSVFSWSYQNLSAEAAKAFGLLGLHPGRDLDLDDAAALRGAEPAQAQAALDELVQAHLLEPAGNGMFAMHDLLRVYAAECAPDRQAPLTRLLDHYTGRAAAAADALFPHDRASRPPLPGAHTSAGAAFLPAEALSWLDSHRPNLVALARFSARNGWPAHSVALSGILWRHFEVGGHYQEALAVHSSAVDAARNDPRGEAGHGMAGVLANLGNVYWWLGDYRDALTYFQHALAGHRERGDADGEARALARIGVVHERLGDYGQAQLRLQEALALYRSAGNRHGEGVQLVNLGTVHRRLGRYAQAAQHHELAAKFFAELGDRRLEGYAAGNLGADYGLLDRHDEALEQLGRALEQCRDSNDPGGQASAMAGIGAVLLRMGRSAQALEQLLAALAISRDTSERGLETEVLNCLGETLRAMGDLAEALDRHEAALALTQRTGDPFEQARALDGIASTHQQAGETARAQEHWRQALTIYARLGVPEADTVRANLASLAR